MNVYSTEYDGELMAIITEAVVFEATDVVIGVPIMNRFFTQNAAWDTGAEITIISPRVVKALGIHPFSHTSIMGVGGDEEVDVYKVHLGLPNGYLYQDRLVCCSDIDDYDILIGMDIISMSDFFLTNAKGHHHFCFRIPAEGGKGILENK